MRRNHRDSSSSSFLRGTVLPLCAATALCTASSPGHAQEPAQEPETDPIEATEWGPVLKRYVEDPVGTREEIIALARNGTDDLPPMGLMFVGDAYLRSGNDATARRMFALVADRDPQSREAAIAHLGLGMVSVRTGDVSDARANFELAAQVPSESIELSTQLAQLGAAQTAAAMGDHDEALEMLEKLAADKEAPAGVRGAAKFARASALYDAGRYDEAAAAFDELAKTEGEAGRDARFAAARARLAGEGKDDGREALQKLVRDCSVEESGEPKPGRNARGLRDLEPMGVLRTWVDNYNELSFEGFYGEAAPLYEIGGCELARTTLASLDRGELAPAPAAEPRGDIQVAQGESAPAEVEEPAPAAPAAAPAPAADSGGPWLLVGILVVAGAIALIALGWFRRKG